jgi:hypothetical protein
VPSAAPRAGFGVLSCALVDRGEVGGGGQGGGYSQVENVWVGGGGVKGKIVVCNVEGRRGAGGLMVSGRVRE